ncbi:hypothetical protein DBV08_07445 [Rhodococcus sp. KBW08]|nr:hypothetical protein DBV08_07445 [Rhodococcus sp. KBW08]
MGTGLRAPHTNRTTHIEWASSPRKVDDAVVCFGGEIGGDYFAEQAGIDLIYKGSGQYTADRVGVITGPP